MKKSAHQIWTEAKKQKLNDVEFKKYLKDNGVIVPKENIDRQHEITEKILNKIKSKKDCYGF